MATTRPDRIGRTRRKLAAMLADALTRERGYPIRVAPEDLHSQIPAYATPQWDCCSWHGTAYHDLASAKAIPIHLASWTRMGHLVREGKIEMFEPSGMKNNEYEIT